MLDSWRWLILIGGALEAVGILLVAWEIRRTAQHVRRFKEPRARGLSVGPAVEVDGAGSVSGEGGQEPSIAERVELLERDVKDVWDYLRVFDASIQKQIKRQTVEASQRVRDEALSRDRVITDLLLGLAERGKGTRILSLVLLLLGVVAATSGSILSLG